MADPVAKIEAADIAVAKATAPVEETLVGRLVGKLGALGDQPPLRMLCGGIIVAGAWRGDSRLAGTGLRMLAAHTLATGIKTLVKSQVDRTRPSLLVEDGEYEAHPGDSDDHDRTSFPSGHTAGVVAVATVFARAYPEHAGEALATAGFLSLVQVPRRAHFVSDVAAGAVVGLVGAAVVGLLPSPLGGEGQAASSQPG
ncbi:phosphatase PAP2 family protein [Sphingosinicellaceae bacterium]|nr:phosphatase PAP2 family protein [Sphingosinicellaceae bacterium]